MFNINNYNEQIKNVPQLGVQVFWSLHSERKPKEEVYEALDEAGIPRGYLSEDESVTNFNNAIKSVVSEYGENMGYKRVASDIERITYRVLQFQINSLNRLSALPSFQTVPELSSMLQLNALLF